MKIAPPLVAGPVPVRQRNYPMEGVVRPVWQFGLGAANRAE